MLVKNPTHPIDLQFEKENLIAAQLVSSNDVLIRATGDDYINVTRDEDSLPLRMFRGHDEKMATQQLPPLLAPPTPPVNDEDENSLPPVRIVKKRLPPKSLPPITSFKLPPKTNNDDA
jgi:hypothetical protein